MDFFRTLQLGQTGSVYTRTARFVLVWHATGFLSISALIVICAVVYTALLFVLKGFTASEMRFFSGVLTRQR